MDQAWHQFLALMDCRDCGPAHGRTWRKDAVVVAIEPCAKHQRMLDSQGWKGDHA